MDRTSLNDLEVSLKVALAQSLRVLFGSSFSQFNYASRSIPQSNDLEGEMLFGKWKRIRSEEERMGSRVNFLHAFRSSFVPLSISYSGWLRQVVSLRFHDFPYERESSAPGNIRYQEHNIFVPPYFLHFPRVCSSYRREECLLDDTSLNHSINPYSMRSLNVPFFT